MADWPHPGEPPHPPAPPQPRRLVPPWPLLSRGLGLALMALAFFFGAAKLLRAHPLLLGVPGAVLALGGFLSAWAAAIHLTGGEKFDDHPWV